MSIGSIGGVGRPNTACSRVMPISNLGSATLRSPSTANPSLALLESLPVISISELPEEHNTCHICKEAFENRNDSELPVRLPCGHIFGKICISKWISNRTCPLCRAIFFEHAGPNAPEQDGEAREPSRPASPMLRQTFSRPTPVVLLQSDGADEENVRRLDLRIQELADERRRTIGYRASNRAQNGSVSLSTSDGSRLAQIEEDCLRLNAALTDLLIEIRDSYGSRSYFKESGQSDLFKVSRCDRHTSKLSKESPQVFCWERCSSPGTSLPSQQTFRSINS